MSVTEYLCASVNQLQAIIAEKDAELTKLKQAIAILLEANEFYANKENCNNAESCFVYEIDSYSGDEVADEGYHARDAKKQVDLILGEG